MKITAETVTYEGTVEIPANTVLGDLRDIEEKIREVGHVFESGWTAEVEGYRIEFRIQAENLWELRGKAEEVARMLASEAIEFDVDSGAWGPRE